ncbi:MAG TPA: fibronectin type III domain-containing protein, partial [Polyangiaceae bacterium]
MANDLGRLAPILGVLLATLGRATWVGSARAGEPSATEGASPAVIAATEEAAASETSAGLVQRADATRWTTNDTSLAVRLFDGTRIVLGPNTKVAQLPSLPVPLGIKDAAARVFCLDLVAGTLDIEIATDKKPIHGVLVYAPRKVSAIVKAGRATLSATEESTTVAARSGVEMSISVSERWRTLRVGRAFTVTKNNPSGSQRTILRAPAAQVDRSVALALGASLPTQRLSWQPLTESLGYWLRLYRLNGSDSQLVRTERVTRTSMDLVGLEPGQY